MPPGPKGKLQAAGYRPIPGSRRHYRSPTGEELTYRQAFVAARGKTLEQASYGPTGKPSEGGPFHALYSLAEQARDAARAGTLASRRTPATLADQRFIASATLKQIFKGHGFAASHRRDEENRRRSERGAPALDPPDTPYRRLVLAVLESTIPVGAKDYARKLHALNRKGSRKERLLVALGRRKVDEPQDVGDS